MPAENDIRDIPPDADNAPDAREVHDLVLDLNFIPTWARKPAGQNPYAQHVVSARDERRTRPASAGQQRDRRPQGGGKGQERRSGGPRERGRGGRDERRGDSDRQRGAQQAPRRLPIEISFIPERDRLSAVVRQMHITMRAYPLSDMAGLFLAKPEHHLLKFEVHSNRGGAGEWSLYQCTQTKAIFLSREAAQAYAIDKNVERMFEAQDLQVEPPTGNFVCVARCRRSGILLGPPNYHGYNEKMLEVRRERFPHMSIDEYRAQVEMVRDPALIEQWKDQQRNQRVYKLRENDEGNATMKRAEAESYLLKNHASDMVHATSRAIVPATIAREMESGVLKEMLHEAWARENRNPFTLMLALRPAFRRMRLDLFKAGRETFVTAIKPRPLEAEHTVEAIKQILGLLRDHPGCTRQQIVEFLRPGLAPDTPEAAELLSPLRWLIEKGHVIEFFNGTLSVPGSRRQGQRAARNEPAAPTMNEPAPTAATPTVPADLS